MDKLGDVLECIRHSLSWLQAHFNEYGYFEKNYYDPESCPKPPAREYAINNGRGLWCTAEGTLAFLETFLTIRKCEPVLRSSGIDTNNDIEWAALEKWIRTTLLPQVVDFFGQAIHTANGPSGNHFGLLPNIPERGTDADYRENLAKVFAVDGTARVLLALCCIRDYWTIEPTQVPEPNDSHPAWTEDLQELIRLSAEAIQRSQYTQTKVGAPIETDEEGGWRRYISDAQPCLTDSTCFAILGLFSADPNLYREAIADGCAWLKGRGRNQSETDSKSVSPNGAKGLGWSWCPQHSDELDPTSTAFALMALSEVLPADEEIIRGGILYIQETLHFKDEDEDGDKEPIYDDLVLRNYLGQKQQYFSVLPTLPRTLAALLKCNAVCDSNYYKTGPDKLIADLADEIVERRRENSGWLVCLTGADNSRLRKARADQCPPDLCKDFQYSCHIWYTYTALHALSLYVLYECGQGNLSGWMPSHMAARLGYDLVKLRKHSEQSLTKADIDELVTRLDGLENQLTRYAEVNEQLAEIQNLLKRRTLGSVWDSTAPIRDKGLRWLKRVLAGLGVLSLLLVAYISVLRLFPNAGLPHPDWLLSMGNVLGPMWLLLVIYAMAFHLGLGNAYPNLRKPPRWLIAFGALYVAFVYGSYFLAFYFNQRAGH
ncbi:MAG TPA: hypothetical protein VF297_29260 [Pyrinomonadaceae bacterium]